MEINWNWAMAQGGVVTRRHLLVWGNTDADIRRALRTGGLERLRPGWFALPGADAMVCSAVRQGGALACASALRWRGVWTVGDGLHLRTGANLPVRRTSGAQLCSCPGRRRTPRLAVDPLPTALLSASRCLPDEELLVVSDSVLNLGLMQLDELERLMAVAPLHARRLVARTDRAESGTETMVRDRLRRRGVPVRTQVVVPGVGRVDLLVGTSLVIEVDSREHHTSRQAYEADRIRDRRLHALGYRVVRLTYRQVVWDWEAAEADILGMLRRGEHRRRLAA